MKFSEWGFRKSILKHSFIGASDKTHFLFASCVQINRIVTQKEK